MAVQAGPNTIDRTDIHTHFAGDDYDNETRSTLNDSTERLGELAYVMLYKSANPRWKHECIVFAKTNLHLLPGYEAAYPKDAGNAQPTQTSNSDAETRPGHAVQGNSDAVQHDGDTSRANGAPTEDVKEVSQYHGETGQATTQRMTLAQAQESVQAADDCKVTKSPSDPASPTLESSKPPLTAHESKPVAAFQQGRDTFKFVGWYILGHVDFLKPRSPELLKMLDQKWSVTDRSGKKREKTRGAEEWEKSLGHRWAVIQMARMEEQPASPIIKHVDGDAQPKHTLQHGHGVHRQGHGEDDVNETSKEQITEKS